MRPTNRIAPILVGLMATVSLFVSCSPTSTPLAGNGSETTNSCTVVGTAVLCTGEPAANASVFVYPADFHLPPSAADSFTIAERVPHTRTDKYGAFRLDSLDTGSYAVEIAYKENRGLLKRCRITERGLSHNLGTNTVRPYGTISGVVRTVDSVSAEIFVATLGLGRIASAGDDDGTFVLQRIPQGKHRLKIDVPRQGWKSTYLETDSLNAGDSSSIGRVEVSPEGATLYPPSSFYRHDTAAPSEELSCVDTPIADLLRVTHIPLANQSYAGSPLLLAETPDGMVVSWTEHATHNIHLTRLTHDGTVLGDDFVTDGHTAQGLIADENGYLVLIADSSDVMWLVRVGPSGETLFGKALAGTQREEDPYYASHLGTINSLHKIGIGLAAYFTIKNGTSYTNRMMFLDRYGNTVAGGWLHGCSRSVQGGRLAFNGETMIALCEGHEGSGSGIYYSGGATPLTSKPSTLLASSGAGKNHLPSLGTPVPGPDGGFLFVYVPDSTVANPTLVHVSPTGIMNRRTLANTEGVDAGYARIGTYGDGYLVSWLEVGILCFLRLDETGAAVGAIERYPLSFEDGLYVTTAWNDMVSFSNGDVGWVYKTGGDELHVSRIAPCL